MRLSLNVIPAGIFEISILMATENFERASPSLSPEELRERSCVSGTMTFTDDDAACFASFWAVMLILRGPALHLHGRNADVSRWRLGAVVHGGRFGPLLLFGFWSCIAVCALPGRLLPFALATASMAAHQIALIPQGLGHSYLLVSASNISLAVSSIVAMLTGNGLRAAVTSAAPAVIEAYAVLMFFAALGKFNNSFFKPKRSAATVHVIGSIENIFAMFPAPCAAAASKLVNAAGPQGMECFFAFTAWLGAIVESAVWMLMYLNVPRLQVWTMYAMHGIFAFTAFDFSVASSGVLPLFGSPTPGAVSAALGWLLGPLGRGLVPAVLVYVVLTPASTNKATGSSHAMKLTLLTLFCRGWFFLAAPILYIPPRIPPGAMLLGYGTEERTASEAAFALLFGKYGMAAVRCASVATLAICILNGLGPYAGWKTAGTFTTLYSNILVERDPNHWTWPLWTRVFRMPWCTLMTDLVTVVDTDAPEIRVRISKAQVTKLVVFRDLLERQEWSGAAYSYWAPVPPAWHTLLEYASPELKSTPVIPYQIPYSQLRCLVSDIVATDPRRDFFVEYGTVSNFC